MFEPTHMCHGHIIPYFPIMESWVIHPILVTPGPGPDEETSGELLGAPHRSFGPGVLSGIAPAIGSTAAEL